MAGFNPDAYLASKTAAPPSAPAPFDPDTYLKSKEPPPAPIDTKEALGLLGPRALTFGLAPVAAGTGAALGALSGTKGSLGEKLSAAGDAYSEGKKERLSAQNEAARQHPSLALASDIGGALATAPLMAATSIPGAIAKGAASGAAYGLGEGEGATDVAKGAATGGLIGGTIQAATPLVEKGLGYIGKGAAKVASGLSGVSEDEIKNYASKTNEINKLIKKSGSEIPAAVEEQRGLLLNDVNTYRKSVNKTIGDVLEKSSDVKMPIQPVIDKLNAIKSKFDPKLQADLIGNIDEKIAQYGSAAVEGNLTPNQMNIIRNDLQEIADKGGAYAGKQGAIIGYSKDLATAAKQAAGEVRKNINKEFPEMATAYNKLAQLHTIQNNLGRGLLKEGGNTTSLMNAAASDTGKARWLEKLADVSGSQSLDNLKDLRTANAFRSPELLSNYKTGKSLTGLVVGGGLGALLDPEDRTKGAVVGSALASPLALKGLINAGNLGRGLINNLPAGTAGAAARNLVLQKRK